ncbi:hypothetical protein [Ferrimonas aestuarii]|uniref:Uncharacterized protein n=1 Tax=Ferrimonas aestuarii TaxID=2569539 RepID=A0A4V5NWH1_9GAMM|nr:hypothetical protein [Ferrimonas aestuarii]TKB57602.1 hypothetical protein FCL42_04835 [Ferrimonas aestuarii]
MKSKYDSLDNLWCEWPEATTAIQKYLENEGAQPLKVDWRFDRARVVDHRSDGYSVYITYSAFEPNVEAIVELTISAKVENNGSISVYSKRKIVEQGI